jgi:hypothetical protein
MSKLSYAVGILLIMSWATGFFVYNLGLVIHVLLMLAVVVFIAKVIKE